MPRHIFLRLQNVEEEKKSTWKQPEEKEQLN